MELIRVMFSNERKLIKLKQKIDPYCRKPKDTYIVNYEIQKNMLFSLKYVENVVWYKSVKIIANSAVTGA